MVPFCLKRPIRAAPFLTTSPAMSPLRCSALLYRSISRCARMWRRRLVAAAAALALKLRSPSVLRPMQFELMTTLRLMSLVNCAQAAWMRFSIPCIAQREKRMLPFEERECAVASARSCSLLLRASPEHLTLPRRQLRARSALTA